jgi:hypothetical protein
MLKGSELSSYSKHRVAVKFNQKSPEKQALSLGQKLCCTPKTNMLLKYIASPFLIFPFLYPMQFFKLFKKCKIKFLYLLKTERYDIAIYKPYLALVALKICKISASVKALL